MSDLDPYAVLGLLRNATPPQVARARRHLAKRNHPDVLRAADATTRMRRINQAWQILSNADRRADYDRRHPWNGSRHGGHWASQARGRPAATSTRTWASGSTAASWSRTVPRPTYAPGGRGIPRTRRPARPEPEDADFRDSGWAALLAIGVLLLVFFLAGVAGSMPT
jgi:curved DNA-binding protein CbpA